MKAIIPAAGLGTRCLPATKSTPKEMLPIVDKPAIQYVVEEAVRSGFDDILIVTGRSKRAIEDHFDRSLELEAVLAAQGKDELVLEVQQIAELANMHYVRQREPLGLGHAVLCGKQFVGDEPFAVLLGDDLVRGDVPVTKQLLDRHQRTGRSVIGVETVPDERVHQYGIVAPGVEQEPGLHLIEDLVEKPTLEEAPSNLGIMGRYLLTPEVFECLETTKPGAKGEIQLTDALRELNETQSMYAHTITGVRYDTGNRLEWLKTNVDWALHRPEIRDDLLAYLRSHPLLTAPDETAMEDQLLHVVG